MNRITNNLENTINGPEEAKRAPTSQVQPTHLPYTKSEMGIHVTVMSVRVRSSDQFFGTPTKPEQTSVK